MKRDTRDTPYLLRLYKAEKATFEECCKLSGLEALSDWVRTRLHAAATEEMAKVGKVAKFTNDTSEPNDGQ